MGGVLVPFHLGLDGHSDADVLVHAIIDALLGAAKIGDIGRLFPDTEPKFKGIDSMLLLADVNSRLLKLGYVIVNIDTVIVAQQPKLAPFIPKMEENIAKYLNCHIDQISVKATTSEKLGFIGAGEGMAAQAVALITRNYL